MSTCLLGENLRNDSGHVRDRFVTETFLSDSNSFRFAPRLRSAWASRARRFGWLIRAKTTGWSLVVPLAHPSEARTPMSARSVGWQSIMGGHRISSMKSRFAIVRFSA